MSYYGTITINGSECIGTSLSSINVNSNNFDTLLYGLSGKVNIIANSYFQEACNTVVDWENGSGDTNHFYLMADNTVRANGYNGYGQLANNYVGYRATEPEICSINGWNPNDTGDSIKSIYCTTRSTYLLSTLGKVWVSGYVNYGTGGGASSNADNAKLNVFCSIPILSNVKKLELSRNPVGYDNSGFSAYALKTDGTIWSWGCNNAGQLGVGNTTDQHTPIQIDPSNTAGLNTYYTDIIAGGYTTTGIMFAIAVKAGKVYIVSCGYNGLGQLGQGDNINYLLPTIISSISNITVGTSNSIVSIKTSGYANTTGSSTYFITYGGNVYSCGYNTYGQLGQGTYNTPATQYNTPTIISGLNNIIDLQCSCESTSVYALSSNGVGYCSLYSWGYNGNGQLGLGDVTQRNSPVLTSMTNVKTVSRSDYSTLITRDINQTGNISVWTCGYNGYGQLGIGNNVQQNYFVQVPLAIGSGVKVIKARMGSPEHNIYNNLQILLSNGRVLTCGYNGNYADGALPNQDGGSIHLPNIVRFT